MTPQATWCCEHHRTLFDPKESDNIGVTGKGFYIP